MTTPPLPHLTPSELEIAERAEKASPGPWIKDRNDRVGNKLIEGSDRVSLCGDLAIDSCTGDDGRFIAHARSDIPALLLSLSEARGRIAKFEESLGYYADAREWCVVGHGAYRDLGEKARAALGAERPGHDKQDLWDELYERDDPEIERLGGRRAK